MSRLTKKSPAADYADAFPVANGRLGAKVFGNPGHEIIRLCEESQWSGAFHDRNNPQCREALKETRTLLGQGRFGEAQEQVFECLSATPSDQTFYCPSGEIHIDFYDGEHKSLYEVAGGKRNCFAGCDAYKREIDFETGIVSSEFSIESSVSGEKDFSRSSPDSSITYTRECFASGSGNVIVYHISSSVPKSIYFRANIEKKGCAKKYSLTNDTVSVLDVNNFPSCIMMTAVSSGGTVCIKGEHIVVEKSDDVTLYIDVETGYRRGHFRSKMGDVHKKPLAAASGCADFALKRICFASGTSYENLKADYISEYSSWNNQALLTVNGTGNIDWDYARYKLICDLGPRSTLPKVTCGLWSENGGEKFSLRGNGMYRSASGMLGLAALNRPLFKFSKRLFRHGKSTAEKMYGVEGFVCHDTTDIWGDSAPDGTDLSTSYSPLGALSFARSLIEYYEYTMDTKVLRKNFKILKSACVFFLNILLPADEKKHLVLSPSFAKEWKDSEGRTYYITEKSMEDSIAIKELFLLTSKALHYLGKSNSDAFTLTLSHAIAKLDAPDSGWTSVDEHGTDDFDRWLCSVRDSILKCRMIDDSVEISLLESVPAEWKNGKLEKMQLMGNICCDIEWKDGRLEKAVVHTERGSRFCRNVNVIYKGRKYPAQISEDGTHDLKNVLPSTVD
ncbi:MAG: glycoside hydrolase family 95 protein [Spirochaetia bacterium]|nr:glycoside hydrolase family 95 protein [Spirochaetia bacterium]